jgi:hypothetical protein
VNHDPPETAVVPDLEDGQRSAGTVREARTLDRTQEVSGSNPLSSMLPPNQAVPEWFNRIRTYLDLVRFATGLASVCGWRVDGEPGDVRTSASGCHS